MSDEPTQDEKNFYEWCEQRGSRKKTEENADKLCDMTEEEFWKYIASVQRGRLATYKKVLVQEKLKEIEQDFE